MRTIPDGVDPNDIESLFSDIFRQREWGQGFGKHGVYGRILSAFCRWDWLFSSNKVHCNSCSVKTNLKTWKHTYYHQMLWCIESFTPITESYCRFINQAPLNASNPDVLVNFVEYWKTTPKKTMYFSWVTDIQVTEENVSEIMRGGRARSENRE
jgi:hypothetical protein